MLLDILAVVVVLGALIWLGVALARTWKRLMATSRHMAEAGERLAQTTAALQAASGADRYDGFGR